MAVRSYVAEQLQRMSQRNFLRRQLMEFRELNGLRKGCSVSAIVHNQLEQGTVKWIGTIKGALYIGVQFESAVGNNFPETNGVAPFPCVLSHSRLVSPADVKTGSRSGNNITMDYHHHHHPRQKQQSQDEDNCLLRSVASSLSYLRFGGSSSDIGTDTDTDNSSVMNRHEYLVGKHKNMDNQCDDEGDDDESDLLSMQSSSLSSSSNHNYSNEAIYANIGDIAVQHVKEFNEKLSVFYKLCSQTKRLIKEYQVKYEEIPMHFRHVEDSGTAVNLHLERLKSFRGDLRQVLTSKLEQCKSEYEMIARYSELLHPTEEMKMSREILDVEKSFSSLDQEICSDIEGLDNFNTSYQNLQDLLHERISRFAVIKTRLVRLERNLVKDESALCLRLKGMQSILSVLERDHDCSDNSDLSRLLDEVQLYDYMDISRLLSQSEDLMLSEKQLLEEVRVKRAILLEAKESYNDFNARLSSFQDWYVGYMKRLNEAKETGPDFDEKHPSLVNEREEKRVQFLEILASAKNLRASIFDSSAVDEKIEMLQEQWRALVQKLYRARSRKTV